MKTENPFGTLYLIPSTLGDNSPLEVLPLAVKTKVEEIDHFIAVSYTHLTLPTKRIV